MAHSIKHHNNANRRHSTYIVVALLILVYANIGHSCFDITIVLTSLLVSVVILTVAILTNLLALVLLVIHLPLGISIDEFVHGSNVLASFASVPALVGRAKFELDKIHLCGSSILLVLSSAASLSAFAKVVLVHSVARFELDGIVDDPGVGLSVFKGTGHGE
jgi:hypothetical protein